jgi:hypothetical protein
MELINALRKHACVCVCVCVRARARSYVHMYVHMYVTDMKVPFMGIRPVMISAKQNKCIQTGTLNNIL